MNEVTTAPPVHWIKLMVIAAVIVAADQITKLVIVHHIPPGGEIPIIPQFFNLTLTYNVGAAFGLFTGLPEGVRGPVLLATTLAAFGVVLYYMRTAHGRSALARIAFALIVGGAIGNLIDRLRLGMVVDFLDVFLGTHHWPAFNVADSSICVGVILLVLAPAPPPLPALEEQK